MSYHTPVLLWESVNGLNIDPSGTYVDATFGGGGHSREILARLTEGRLFSLDQDKEASANIPENEKFCFIHGNFRFVKNYLRYYGISKVDGILADLGISSHHIDIPERGFSYRHEGRLDMRMNTSSPFTAADLINHYTRDELKRVFKGWGELENSASLAGAIIEYRANTKILYTHQLLEAVSSYIPARHEKKYLSKLFQSLRIEVNKEISNLKELLLQSASVLKKGGRLVIISYHSLEDRLVKNYIRYGNPEGEVIKDIYGNQKLVFRSINKKPLVPTEAEINSNIRARSARLRIAEKMDD